MKKKMRVSIFLPFKPQRPIKCPGPTKIANGRTDKGSESIAF
jgi:hypothetical protein